MPGLSGLSPNNLPHQTTSFIGREREEAEVRRLLSVIRLLTLTGSGGAGKTRLALQVAAEVLEEFPDGVWLAELAAVSDPSLVPKAVATSLGVPEQPGRELADTLADSLRVKSVLVILDNCEHLVAACARLVDALLRACPNLRMLATSREALGVTGETTWRVPSLSLPDPLHLPPLDHLKEYGAVRLFIDRAVASDPQFAVTTGNAPAVAQVCHRLDGIPLAIELAAARVKVLAVEQIAARLEDRFRLLTGGSRTALPRQQTLRAAMDWSYALLSEQEQAVLRRLSGVDGGGTLEAAEAVCAREDVNSSEILDLLTQLVDKSLVIAETHSAEARYRLLETVRHHARDRVLETGEDIEARRRHRDWFLGLAETADLHMGGREEESWIERLEIEHDNFRAALEWCLTVGRDTEAALRLGGSLGWLWYVRGHYSEGIKWLERALSLKSCASPAVRSLALGTSGYLAAFLGQRERAIELSEEALLLAREVGDKSPIGHCLVRLGYCALVQGDFDKSQTVILEGLALFREVGDKNGIAQAINCLGEAARSRGDYQAALTLYQDSVAIKREIGDRRGIAMTVVNLGFMALHQGDYQAGASFFREALGLNRNFGYKKGIPTSITGLAGVALEEGQPDRAVRLLGAANVMLEAISGHFDPPDQVDYDRFLSNARATLGENAFEEAWAEGRAMPLEQAIAYALAPGPSPLNIAGSEKAVLRKRLGHLTLREEEIAGLIAKGLTNRRIATKLAITKRTADTHVQHILNKLGVNSRAEIAAWAVEHGFHRPILDETK
jgi:predicted ATPase/DNA-binding CsgD family transcriptional regulator